MAGFLDFNPDSVNYRTENKLLPAGTYEIIIKSVEVRATRGNNPHGYMNFDLVVRKDLDEVPELAKTNAAQHGRYLLVSVWTSKDDAGNDSGKHDPRVSSHTVRVAGLPATNLNSVQEYMNALFNKPIRASITIRENEYQGQKQKQNKSTSIYFKKGSIKPAHIGWYQTKYPLQPATQQQLAENSPATSGGQDPFSTSEGTQTLSDKDSPFQELN